MLAKAVFVLKKLWRFGGFLSVEVWAIWFPGSVGESCKFKAQSGLCSRAVASLPGEEFACICPGLQLALLNPFKSPAWLPADLNIFLLSPGFSRACLFNSSHTWEFLCTFYRQWWKIYVSSHLWLFQWTRMYYNDNCCHLKKNFQPALKSPISIFFLSCQVQPDLFICNWNNVLSDADFPLSSRTYSEFILSIRIKESNSVVKIFRLLTFSQMP